MFEGCLDAGDAPVGGAAARSGLSFTEVGMQPEFEPADLEPDVERLIEVRRLPEGARIPVLGDCKIWHLEDDGAEAEGGGGLVLGHCTRLPCAR